MGVDRAVCGNDVMGCGNDVMVDRRRGSGTMEDGYGERDGIE